MQALMRCSRSGGLGLLVVLLSFLCGCQRAQAPNGATAEPDPIPTGWQQWPTPPEYRHYEERCASIAQTGWAVTSESGAVKIASSDVPREIFETLPFKLKRAEGMTGDRRVQEVSDGWLVGFDAGEWGGTLWWFSSDGRSREKLLSENVRGFVKNQGRIFVMTGLAHLGGNGGVLYEYVPTHAVREVANLMEAPKVGVALDDGTLAVVTTNHVYSIAASGVLTSLAARNFNSLRPTSIVVAKSGAVYVGMSFFVLRLNPRGSTYSEQWLVPAGCDDFRIDPLKDTCNCEMNGVR